MTREVTGNTYRLMYILGVLGINITAAVAIPVFLRFLIPMPETKEFFQHYPHIVVYSGLITVLGIAAGAAVMFLLMRPIRLWWGNPDAQDQRQVQRLVVRIPIYQTAICAVVWVIIMVLTTLLAATISAPLTLIIFPTVVLTALEAILLTYLLAERVVRPLAARALEQSFTPGKLQGSIKSRIRILWTVTSALPLVGIVLLLLGDACGIFPTVLPAITALAALAILAGFFTISTLTRSMVDPISELRKGIERVRQGNLGDPVNVYDGTEIGVLQVGYNALLTQLRERLRFRDIFNKYVGDQVAEHALRKDDPTLGGEELKVAALFVDVISSTTFVKQHSPTEAVAELNKFFAAVVEVIHRHHGIINKFQGDAVLAVFGAPSPLEDATTHALAAARELHDEIDSFPLQAGIGVCTGLVVAGNIGSSDRFEYTIIGDAVNSAARLTELAKKTPSGVLTNVSTLNEASLQEQSNWTLMTSVELRGRQEMTQLARPTRSTLAEQAD